MSDDLRAAWQAHPVAKRRAVTQALEGGKAARTHRDATFAVWLGLRQMRRGWYVAGVSFVILATVFVGLRVVLEGASVVQALADPTVWVVAVVAAGLQLLLFRRQVRKRFARGVAANVAKLENRSAKGDLDIDAALATARERGWLERQWTRMSR